MYKLYVFNSKTNEEKVLKFESMELAILYRDYHLAFGLWSTVSKWISEDDINESQKKFIIDSKYMEVNGVLKKFFKISDGFEISIKKEEKSTIKEHWNLFRYKRELALKETDWTQLADVNLDTEERKEYRSYRSYLRDLPKLYDDNSVVYAKVYNFEDWKKGKR